MRWFGPLLVLGLLSVVPWSQARAQCMVQGVDTSPSPGRMRTDAPAIQVGPNPTVFAFWGSDLKPRFEAVCDADGEALSYALEELPSAPDTTVARIQVDTAACSRFVVREVRDGHASGRGGATIYEVDSSLGQDAAHPRPDVLSAQRENKRYGCGPSSHLKFETNVRSAALRVEVEPGGHSIVVPLRDYDASATPGERGEFWLGRTMCRGPNLPESSLDQPMSVRLSALYTDGSTDVGSWQKINPPPGTPPGHDGVAYTVEAPPPPWRSAAVEDAELPGDDWRSWLWLLLAIPGVLALAGSARWAASRRS